MRRSVKMAVNQPTEFLIERVSGMMKTSTTTVLQQRQAGDRTASQAARGHDPDMKQLFTDQIAIGRI